MSNIFAKAYLGAYELYSGIPDLLNATVTGVVYDNTSADFRTTLILKDESGNLHGITIAEKDET